MNARRRINRKLAGMVVTGSLRLLDELEARAANQQRYVNLFDSGLWVDLTAIEQKTLAVLRKALQQYPQKRRNSRRKHPP